MATRKPKASSHVRSPEELYDLAGRFVRARDQRITVHAIQEEYCDGSRYISSTTVHMLVRAWRAFETIEVGLLLKVLRDMGHSRLALLLKLRDPVALYREGHLPGISTPIREMPLKEMRRWVEDQRTAVQVIRDVKDWSLRKAEDAGLPIEGVVDLVVVAVYSGYFKCRSPVGRRLVMVTPSLDGYRPVPGEIVTVRVISHSVEGADLKGSHILAELQRGRVAPEEIGLVPLGLRPQGAWHPDEHPQGAWHPDEHYWGDRIEPCFKKIIAAGPRPSFEKAQIVPGCTRYSDPDPILLAMNHFNGGDPEEAKRILMGLLARDLRCLDAFAHLGLVHFHSRTFKSARRYFEMGVRIGELSLGSDFRGVLPWGHINNRPFHRCLHGVALCFWRDDEYEQATLVLDRMLWLNPWDNLGARFVIEKVKKRVEWKA